jgi:hypothetical protein
MQRLGTIGGKITIGLKSGSFWLSLDKYFKWKI